MAKRLFIAEKPSVAKEIAAVLGGKACEGYHDCGNDIVTYCFGHMFEQAEPDAYLPDDIPKFPNGKKKWRFEDLPIVPQQWIIYPKDDCKKQLKIIQRLIKECDVIVNAGDPDREGQLLVDELLEYYHVTQPVMRYWANAADEASVRAAINNLQPNNTYVAMGEAAKARARADWLIGMNLSRGYTLKAAEGGARDNISVGRVQTPTLALVVSRDLKIENFKPIPFFTLKCAFTKGNITYSAKWIPGEDQKGLDEEGRLVDQTIAQALAGKLTGQTGQITKVKHENKKKPHPLGLSLTRVTSIASAQWGYTQAQVLEICQSLYETHKLTSYPRTDCDYLPEVQHAEAPKVLAALMVVNPDLATLIGKADPSIKSRVWNDKKISAHHGIIPTLKQGNRSVLNDKELNIYLLVVRHYLAQFFPALEFLNVNIETQVVNEQFKTSVNIVTKQGWGEVFGGVSVEEEAAADDEKALEESRQGNIQDLKTGDQVICSKAESTATQTKPPSRFTEGSIGDAMANIHTIIEDPAMKKLLKEGEGIGTTATRSGIIEELKKRGFLENKGKKLISTTLGRSVIASLPVMVKNPVLTALTERSMQNIQSGQSSVDEFVSRQIKFVSDEIEKTKMMKIVLQGGKVSEPVSTIYMCQVCGKGLIRRASKKTKGRFWWGCSNHPTCRETYMDMAGRPNYSKPLKANQNRIEKE